MRIVFNIDIVSSASREPFSNSRINAEDFINHRFANNRSHIFFALTTRDLPNNLIIQEVYFSKDSNNQELVII
jgi:hypothetical protein